MHKKNKERLFLNVIIGILFALFFLFQISVSAADNSTVPISIHGKFDYYKAYEVFKYTNEARAKKGLPELVLDADLMDAAMQRAAEIQLIFDHTRPDGTSCFTISDKVNGENIAAGQTDAKSVMNSWMTCPPHYRNMMDIDFVSIGVGCFYQGNTICWVQLFGMDPAVRKAQREANRTKSVTIAMNRSYFDNYSLLLGRGINTRNMTVTKGTEISLLLGFESDMPDMETFTCDGSIPFLDWRYFRVTSSNPGILSINGNGKLTAYSKGKATIKFVHTLIPDIVSSCEITVKENLSRTVVLDANSGFLKNSSQKVRSKKLTVTNKKKFGNLPNAYRSGYQFTGWYTKKSGGIRINSDSMVQIAEGRVLRLYAHWKKITVNTPVTVSTVSNTKSKINVRWKTISNVSGYEVSVSTSKNFEAKNTKTVHVYHHSKSAYTFGNLKGGQTYYIRVRGYKLDSLKKRVYGKYSAAKACKTRRG